MLVCVPDPVRACGRVLLQAECAQQDSREALFTDFKKTEGTLCLCAPVSIRRNLDGTERIMFDSRWFGHSALEHRVIESSAA
jgi:hypothetical protein